MAAKRSSIGNPLAGVSDDFEQGRRIHSRVGVDTPLQTSRLERGHPLLRQIEVGRATQIPGVAGPRAGFDVEPESSQDHVVTTDEVDKLADLCFDGLAVFPVRLSARACHTSAEILTWESGRYHTRKHVRVDVGEARRSSSPVRGQEIWVDGSTLR